MKIDGAIFDVDGTLLNSMVMWDNISYDYLRAMGKTPRKDLTDQLRERSLYQAAEYFISDYGIEGQTPEQVMQGINDMIEDFYMKEVTLKDGVLEFLKKLKKSGTRICAATASDRYLVEGAFKLNGILEYFDAIFTCTEVGSGKDTPEIFNKAFEFLGTKKENTYVFEDAYFALLTAKKAGFNVVGIWDITTDLQKDDVKNAADIYINSYSEMEKYMMKKVLTIAGSDCSGGAGIQADLKTFSAHGVFGMSVIVSVVAENTSRVIDIEDVSPDMIKKQIDAVFEDIGVDAVKIGMLSTPECMEAVAEKLNEYKPENIVIDPVMYAKNGCPLMDPNSIGTLIEKIIPLADVLTPNIPEAEKIANVKIETVDDMKNAAKIIYKMGCKNVLVKGGHYMGDAVDVLYDGTDFHCFETVRIDTKNTHGTGCTYSSSIASNLANGLCVPKAVEKSKKYVTTAIKHSLAIGKGHGPTHHFYDLYNEGIKWMDRD